MPRIEKIQALLEKEPDDAFLNFGLAMEFVKAGRTEDALTAFDRTLSIDPNYSAAHFHKGNTLISLGRLEDARTVLENGVEVTKKNGDPHAQREIQELLAGLG